MKTIKLVGLVGLLATHTLLHAQITFPSGGTNDGDYTNVYTFTPMPYVPGLKLAVLPPVGTNLFLNLLEADPAGTYDIFAASNLVSASWNDVLGGTNGQTNFTLPIPFAGTGFFRAARTDTPVTNTAGMTASFPNNDVNTSLTSASISGGVAAALAVLVNDTNLADAVWVPFSAIPNVLLGTNDGTYSVMFGFIGADGQTNWTTATITLDTTPPQLTITNPTASTVSVPMIQVQGYASEDLSSLTFDVSNAGGVITNQTGYWQPVFYDTNQLAFTTNSFQCYDIPLTNGLNTITLHATDLAGNTTTTNVSYTLDYSGDTTPPALSVTWPQNGTAISGSNFTFQGLVDDATATVMATIADGGGDTNTVTALVQRDGTVWAQNLPLGAGANTLTITATDAAGNVSATNLTLYQSSVLVTLTPFTSDQFNQSSVTVSGTVSDSTATLTVNGVTATVNTNGTWTACGVPVSPTGAAILDVEVSGGSEGMAVHAMSGGLIRAADSSPDTTGGSQQAIVPQPATVVLASYVAVGHYTDAYYVHPTSDDPPTNFSYNGYLSWDETVDWSYASGGSVSIFGDFGNGTSSGSIALLPDDAGYVAPEFFGAYGPPPSSPFAPVWEEAAAVATYGSVYTTVARNAQTSVMVAPGRPALAGTATYLVRACASECSAPYAPYEVSVDDDNGWQVIFSLIQPALYAGDTPLPPEWLKIQNQTLINTGITNTDGSVWGVTAIQAAAGATADATPTATQVHHYRDYTFDVQAVELLLAADNNRDGSINFDNSDATSASQPYRFWVNDAQENGDISTAANAVPGSSSPNYALNNVNGRSDLVNFFPVALCLSNLLQWLPVTNGFEYHLSQADGAVKFVYTGLTQDSAFDYLTDATATDGYGVDGSEAPQSADTIAVSSSGTTLDTNWLAQVQNNGGTGIILMEGCAATTSPLYLEVWHRDQYGVLQKLGGVPMYLSIGGVEQMYRWVNLRHVTGETETRATDTSQPANYPDSLSDGKQFVFVHGYNVDENAARGWNAEMFKRLYQAHSHAMFTAVTWQGEEGQWPVFGITPDYYENVVNAFDTASNLASVVSSLPGQKYIAGHSLGNMVVASAIVDCGLNVNAYFMIDAAVAMEAYNSGVAKNMNLVPTQYWPNYHTNLWASEWFNLFDSSDGRNQLTWQNRFGNIPNAYNYYSSTEDVLANADGQSHSITGSPFAWMNQEMLKGSWASSIITLFSHSEAGWGLGDYSHLSFDDANNLTTAQLQTDSVFESFDDTTLYDVSNGSAEAAKPAVREKVLADGIPALSNAAGANDIGNVVAANHNMNNNKGLNINGLWPRSGDDWRHSDIVNIAYPFNHKTFEQIITDGGLQ